MEYLYDLLGAQSFLKKSKSINQKKEKKRLRNLPTLNLKPLFIRGQWFLSENTATNWKRFAAHITVLKYPTISKTPTTNKKNTREPIANQQKMWTGISQNRKHKWPVNSGKEAQPVHSVINAN